MFSRSTLLEKRNSGIIHKAFDIDNMVKDHFKDLPNTIVEMSKAKEEATQAIKDHLTK